MPSLENYISMMFNMFRWTHNHQIFNSIIKWVFINMMNYFVRSKTAANMFFHYINRILLIFPSFSSVLSNVWKAPLPSPILWASHCCTYFLSSLWRYNFTNIPKSNISFMFFGVFSSPKNISLVDARTLYRACFSNFIQSWNNFKKLFAYQTRFSHTTLLFIIITIITLVSYSKQSFSAQTTDILPEVNSQQSTAVLNNILRQQANAIDVVGAYFNTNGYLQVTSGGTGASGLTGLIKGNGTSAMTAITIPADATKFLDGTGAFVALPADVNTSNHLFEYTGQVDQAGSTLGEWTGTTIAPSGAISGTYRALITGSNNYTQVWTSKFIKVAGISTVTVWARIWQASNSPEFANVKVDVGGVNNSVSGTVGQKTPEWLSFTIDVSSLTNGVSYDVTASLKSGQSNGVNTFCSNIIGFGS